MTSTAKNFDSSEIAPNFIERFIFTRGFYRFLEALPGLLSWTLIIGPVILAAFYPVIVAYFILFYSVYWVYNSIKFVAYAFLGHQKLLYVTKQNWLERLQKEFPDTWNDYYYISLIPYASESYNILQPTVESILNNNFPNSKKILCLSSEKALPAGKEIAEQLKKEYEGKFTHIFITEHELKEGELKGKSSNQNHGGRFVYDEIIKLGIDPKKVLITSNDSDVLNHPQYIPYLLYKFLLEGDKKFSRIYQPVPTDYTEYWDAPFFSRLIVSLGVQWRLALQQRNNYRCTVYAFYSMSLHTLKEIGFWDVDLIPEDERTMFNALFRYGSEFRVIPMFITTAGKPVQGKTLWKSFKEQYIQIRRWTWGASEFAYTFTASIKNKHIPWKAKILPLFNQVRTSVEWASSSVLPMFGGFMPGLLNESFRATNISYTLPSLMFILFNLSTIMLIFIVAIEYRIAPKRPKEKGLWFQTMSFAQWILLPYVGFVLSSIPALEAQTRLIFNKRIQYVESRKEK
jgi:Glycosyl transferase family group 2